MSVFDKLEVVIRCATHVANVPPLNGEPASDANTCDIIDENGRPVFLDATNAQSENVSLEFGSEDVAVLLARDRGAGLMIVRIQVTESARHKQA